MRHYISRDADGALEPIKHLIGQSSLMNYVLAAINEIRSAHIYGISMKQVVDYYFPYRYRAIIQFVLYPIFSGLGYYACQKNNGFAAAVCLLGAVCCLGYTANMAFCLALSDRRKRKLVQEYIEKNTGISIRGQEKMLQKSKRFLQKKLPMRISTTNPREMEDCVLGLAVYIGQKWNNEKLWQVPKAGEEEIEKTLLLAVEKWLSSMFSEIIWLKTLANSINKEEGNHSSTRVADIFPDFFSKSEDEKKKSAKQVLYIDCVQSKNEDLNVIRQFQKQVFLCSQIWEQLFKSVGSAENQSRLTCKILHTALYVNEHIFVMMAFGLIIYLDVLCPTLSDDASLEMLKKQLEFLLLVIRSDEDALTDNSQKGLPIYKRQNSSDQIDFINEWAEILYIVVAMIQWGVFLKQISDEASQYGKQMIWKIQALGFPKSYYSKMQLKRENYIVYAFLLFSQKNNEIFPNLTVRVMQDIEQAIQSELQIK